MYLVRRISLTLLIAAGTAAALHADAFALVTKARAYLGSEAALNGVNSLHYIGMVQEDVAGAKSPAYRIDMIFQKEYKQRLVITRSDAVEITALDDYEAWHRVQDPGHPEAGNTSLYSINTVKQLRSGTWENLAFFSGIEKVGGQCVEQGVVDIEGHKAQKISFIHDPTIVYIRLFDSESGKLILTETDQGMRIREEGEIRAGGIRFPQRITNSSTGPDGKNHVVTVTIEQITVNETFPDDLFRVPLAPPH